MLHILDEPRGILKVRELLCVNRQYSLIRVPAEQAELGCAVYLLVRVFVGVVKARQEVVVRNLEIWVKKPSRPFCIKQISSSMAGFDRKEGASGTKGGRKNRTDWTGGHVSFWTGGHVRDVIGQVDMFETLGFDLTDSLPSSPRQGLIGCTLPS